MSNNKDQLNLLPLLCIGFLLGLIALGFLPEFSIFGYQVKKIDMFSDIKKEVTDKDTLLLPVEKEKLITQKKDSIAKKVSPCPDGMVCLEDYSKDQTALKAIFGAFSKAQNEKVRIAFYGDSFIEGDVMCGDFRELLQNKFGGSGVGFVPITAETGEFRQTIKEKSKGIEIFNVVQNRKDHLRYPPFGFKFFPGANNFVEYRASTFSPKTSELQANPRLFYESDNAFSVKVSSNGQTIDKNFQSAKDLNSGDLSSTAGKNLKLEFPDDNKLALYGVSFESGNGVYVDNYGLRGNSGISLEMSSDAEHKALNEIQDYKLIILQYGLNVISEKEDFDWFIKMTKRMIKKLKADYPNTSILLMSVSDRSHKVDGKFQTIPAVEHMVEIQRGIAQEYGIAFWDTYHAMGGKNSMIKLVESKPAKANRDYTHLNFLGGKDIANLLFNSLIHSYEDYSKP